MTTTETKYGVWLAHSRVGSITQRGDHTRFTADRQYLEDPGRPVLGLIFEQDLLRPHAAALRLPPWFSNLLPEGVLRQWVADDRGVSVDREMELLAQVGHDLPGGVRILPSELSEDVSWEQAYDSADPIVAPAHGHPGWRFSLAGVQMKFSMVKSGDRLTLPAHGEGGDWIVKLPDHQYVDVPANEFAMMSLAAAVGIDVPEIRLVDREQVQGLPDNVWPRRERWAYAIRRFDRSSSGRRIHIEDLAQVCNVYPERKYSGNYESVASLIYRRRDVGALKEFTRRLAFIVLIGNGDAHLKNWSLIYTNQRVPTLAPAYDLVSTSFYHSGQGPEDLGLRFGGSKLFERVNVRTFKRLQEKLGATLADLDSVAEETAVRTRERWPEFEGMLSSNRELRDSIGLNIKSRSETLLRRA